MKKPRMGRPPVSTCDCVLCDVRRKLAPRGRVIISLRELAETGRFPSRRGNTIIYAHGRLNRGEIGRTHPIVAVACAIMGVPVFDGDEKQPSK